jgi:acyl-[acyl-carrier-protein] desaturase
LPNSQSDTFFDEVKLREIAKELPYDFWVTLVGDTITEEALPTYESWLMDVERCVERNGWSKWIRQWTGEENRHGFAEQIFVFIWSCEHARSRNDNTALDQRWF